MIKPLRPRLLRHRWAALLAAAALGLAACGSSSSPTPAETTPPSPAGSDNGDATTESTPSEAPTPRQPDTPPDPETRAPSDPETPSESAVTDPLAAFQECVASGGLQAEFTYNDAGEVVVIDILGDADDEVLDRLEGECGPFLADYEGGINIASPPGDFVDEALVPGAASTCTATMTDFEVCTLVPRLGFGLDGIATGPGGVVFVANFGGDQPGTVIYRVTEEGEPSVFSDRESAPLNLVAAPDGAVVVGRGAQLMLIDEDGSDIAVLTADDATSGLDPIGVDSNGSLYVSVSTPGPGGGVRIDRITNDGAVTTIFDDPEMGGGPAAVDSQGTIYLATTDTVFVVDESGATELANIPEASGDNSDIDQAGFGGMTIVGDERLYLTSFFARGVYEVDLDGSYRIIAGGNPGPAADGVGTAAGFTTPNRIAYDGTQNRLYLTDYLDSSVRAIQLPNADQ